MPTLDDIRTRFRYVRGSLALVQQAAAKWTVAWLVLLVIQGIIPAGTVYLTKAVVDSVAAAIGAGLSWEVLQTVLIPVGAMVALLLLQQIMGGLVEWINTAQTELVQDHIKALIHRKAVEVDYAFYENSEYYDRLEQANTQASSRSLALLQNIGGLLQGLVTLLSISAILITYNVFLPLVLIISTLPALYVVVKHNMKQHDWWKHSTAERRWAYYFDSMLTMQGSAAEVRIFDLGGFFSENYQAIRKKLRGERLSLLKQQTIAKLWAGLLALAVTGAVMGWMVVRALNNLATLGDLALFYQAFNQGQGLMRSLLNNAGQIYTNTLFLEHLFELLKAKPEIKSPPAAKAFPKPISSGVQFHNITFRYPGMDVAALEDFDLDIPAGKIVAIVGENGAGKSTLTKLLCRFYDPQEGTVEIDGTDIRDFRLEDLRDAISIMFQLPVKYHAVVAENIGLGSLAQRPSLEDIEEAAKGAGAHDFIMRLRAGYQTLLGRLFTSGTDLSGGEWQRIALARAFLRKGQIVVLDEPTASMDSWAENEWLRRFRNLVKNRTAIIITHRFTTAMQADIIHVMDDGRVIESGTHEELIAQGGRYASSWMEQMRIEETPPSDLLGLSA